MRIRADFVGTSRPAKFLTRALHRSRGKLLSAPSAPDEERYSCSVKSKGMEGSPAPILFRWDINWDSSPLLGGRLNLLSIPETPASAPPPWRTERRQICGSGVLLADSTSPGRLGPAAPHGGRPLGRRPGLPR